jgi:multisubunit Na+/H+ antiporter MnhE subunit
MDSSTFILFLILMGLAFTSGNQTFMYIGLGVGAIFLVTMGGAHHIIVAIVALGIIYFGSQTGNSDYMLYSLLVAGGLFLLFVLHGKEDAQPAMEGYPMDMGALGLPMGY